MKFFTTIRRALAKMPDQLTQLVQQMLQQNTKSTVLKPLGWLITILSASTILASRYGLDKWA